MKTRTLAQATRRILLAAAVALGLAQSARADKTYYWTGKSSMWWGIKGNWSTSSTPAAGDNKGPVYFQTDKWQNSSYIVKINDQYKFNGHVYVRAGAVDKPVNFKALNSSNNVTTGNGFDNNNGRDTYGKRLYVGDTVEAWLTICSGTYTMNGVEVGSASCAGHLNLESADVVSFKSVGAYDVLLKNGDITSSAATVSAAQDMKIGTETGVSATVTKNSGNWTASGTLYLGTGQNAVASFFNNGGDLTVAGIVLGDNADSDGGSADFEVGGGTVSADNGVSHGTGSASATFRFNGGMLKATAAGTLIAQHENMTVSVSANGGTIDADNYDVTVASDIGNAAGATGTMTFNGNGGTVRLTGAANYTGMTYLNSRTHLVVKDEATKNAILARGLTIVKSADASANGTFTLLSIADGTACTSADFSSITLGAGLEGATLSIIDGAITIGATQTWSGAANTSLAWGGQNWDDGDSWEDGNDALFATDGAIADVDAPAEAYKIMFNNNAAVTGSATLTAAKVDVSSGVTGTISAPTSGALEKTGAGALTLGASRTDQTTLSEGTLKMASDATVDPAKLTLGTDPAKPVVFDYAGQTLTANPTVYLGAGMDVTLANGVFTYENDTGFNQTTFPSILTVASGATLQTDGRFNWTTDGEATINIAGGTAQSIVNNNNWIMHASYQGRLNINVTNGGLLEFGGDTYMLTCRNGDNIYKSPELHMKVVDSTVSVKNGKSLRLGRDDSTKASATPELTLAATNSVFDIGWGIYIGNDKTGLKTDGFYKTDFENCVITAKQFRVYNDRPLNNARLNNSRIVFNATGDITAYDDDAKWITVDEDGLVLDTNGKSVSLNANLGGSGAVTKVGSGKLTVAASQTNQTATAALNVNEGVLALAGGITVARPLVFADGATLDVTGTSSASIASLTLPAEGSVTLTMNGGAFAKGLYKILEKSGIAVADVQGKLVPSAGELPCVWSVTGDTLYLTVDNPPANFWTGLGGDLKMSTAANWAGGAVPAANSDLDFSGVPSGTTIDADADYAFGNVTMGANVVTFTGSLTATSFSDSSKVEVGANATVTFDDDLMFTGSGKKYVVYKVDAGGKFIVTGKVGLASGASGDLVAQYSPGTGAIVAGSLVNDSTDNWIYVAQDNNATTQYWAIGPGGITGTATSAGMWVYSNDKVNTVFQPNTNDFTVSLWTVLRENAKSFTYNTTGLDGLGHTITLDAGFSDKTAPLYVAGTGKVVVNHVTESFGGKNAYSGPVTVTNSATLAINAGKKLTSDAITMNTGTTLEVAESAAVNGSASVTLGGKLTLKDGAMLAFNYTTRNKPVLDLTNTTVTFDEGETTNIVVKVSAKVGVWPKGGANVLTSGGKFADATISLAEGYPKWVKGVRVNDDGNIEIDVKPAGLIVEFR